MMQLQQVGCGNCINVSPAMIDYHTNRFTTRQIATASGIEPVTLRSLFSRGHFRVIGEKGVPGEATLFSLRDAMHYALSARLMQLGVAAKTAFELAIQFSHMGDEDRLPAALFDIRERGESFFVYWPDRGQASIVASDAINSIADLQWSPNVPDYAFQIVQLNQLENQVFTSLGVDRRP